MLTVPVVSMTQVCVPVNRTFSFKLSLSNIKYHGRSLQDKGYDCRRWHYYAMTGQLNNGWENNAAYTGNDWKPNPKTRQEKE